MIAVSEVVQISLENIRTDGGTQPRVTQDWDAVAEYAQRMLEGDVFPPVIVYYDDSNYWLADGFHRYHAARQAGIVAINADIRHGTQDDAIECSCSANASHGLRRTNKDKEHSVLRLLRLPKWQKRSDREIASQCGVSHPFVSKLRSGNGYQIAREVERNGTTYTIVKPQIERRLDDDTSPGIIGFRHRFDDDISEIQGGRNVDNIPLAVPHISSKNNEWYTPQKYVNAARALMGDIDLDPASNDIANETVKAKYFYDKYTNGLDKDWTGRIWLNPPYGYTDGRSNQDIWSGRLIDQFKNKITTEAVLLVNAAVDTRWFQRLFEYPVCLTLGRINFTTPEATLSGSTHGSAFVYFGSQSERFVELFREFGIVGKLVERW